MDLHAAAAQSSLNPSSVSGNALAATRERWYALNTSSHAEWLAYDQLAAKGFQPFLPTLDVWSKRGGARHLANVPMFPGYLFIRHDMDRWSHMEVGKMRGVVRVLGADWDHLTAVPDVEIDALQRVASARIPVMPHPFLRLGARVRVTRGPLADIEGLFVRTRSDAGLLVLSVDVLRQSVAVAVASADVLAA